MASTGIKGFNSSYWSKVNTKIPTWFPDPHPVWCTASIHAGKWHLPHDEKKSYSWIPSYTTVLCGEGPTLATRRSIIALLRTVWWRRPDIALYDDGVCPMSKTEFRYVTASSAFQKNWPHDSWLPYKLDQCWAWGLPSLWGRNASAEQREITRAHERSEDHRRMDCVLGCRSLDCDHDYSTIDWETETELVIAMAMALAEDELVYQLCLLDPDLTRQVHHNDVDHPHPKRAPINIYTYHDSPTVRRKAGLVTTIVIMDGDRHLRGWERDDFDGRKRWVEALAHYLGPLWSADDKLRDEQIYVCHVGDVHHDKISAIENMSKLNACETALLSYWMIALQRDHKVVPVPFFASSDVRLQFAGDWLCARCRSLGPYSPLSVTSDLESE